MSKQRYTTSQSKELVTLRHRKMKDGGSSLYLDYMIDGMRTREFLKMYLVPERTKIDELQNQETLKAANLMKARRIVEIQSGKAGMVRNTGRGILLTEYLDRQAQRYLQAGKTSYAKNLGKLKAWIVKYNPHVKLKAVNKQYLVGFINSLKDAQLARSTIRMYYEALNTMFNNAYRDDLITESPFRKLERCEKPELPDNEREYLTLDEISRLMQAPCRNEQVRRAFLFACFTGLRLVDIEGLDWSRIKRSGEGWQLEKRQKKTGRFVYVPLSDNALQWLPKRGRGRVFSLPHRSTMGDNLRTWIMAAGITKHISFHCSRHTYATLLFTYGADIYTVSSLLGHSNLATTQIYARIVDKKKTDAVSLIPRVGEK